MSPAAPEDGFHEIQLNGKQLVFLFMAMTVVSVVIFLCGVLVGRGVRAERTAAADAAAASDTTSADIKPSQSPSPATAASAAADPTAAAPPPPPPAEELSYFKRLEDPKQPQEELKKPAASPTPAPAPAASAPKQNIGKNVAPSAAPGKEPAVAKEPVAAPVADAQPPASQGFAVQIAALNVRSEADAIAKHLSSKGYSAYVSANGTPAIYRVRVGTFKTRREAESIAAKLQKEEQLKPWVTR